MIHFNHFDKWSHSSGVLDDDRPSKCTHIFNNLRHIGPNGERNANIHQNNAVPRFGYWDLDHRCGSTHIFNNTRNNGPNGERNANIHQNNAVPRFGYWDLDHRCGSTHIFNNTRHIGQNGEHNANIHRNNLVNPISKNKRLRSKAVRMETKRPTKVSCFPWLKRGCSLIF